MNYVGPEWTSLTGQSVEDALRDGWIDMVHPQDQSEVVRIFLEACESAATFTLRYRLRRPDGSYRMIVAGAAPSMSPVDGSFVGYLGALSEVSDVAAMSDPRAVALSKVRPSSLDDPIDKITDLVLLARAAAEILGDRTLVASLDVTLSLIFVKLGGSRSAH